MKTRLNAGLPCLVTLLQKKGAKVYSQNDEDGITLEILRRISLDKGSFLEIGVGDGTENNTLVLLGMGWRGVWVGCEDVRTPKQTERFVFDKKWVVVDNVRSIIDENLKKIGADNFDVVCVDIDGNDIYISEEIVKIGIRPKVFIVEYNPRFVPPLRFQIEYNETHAWSGDDYYGASLQSYADMLSKYGYMLVCCNTASATNAFFVDVAYKEFFTDIPENIRDLYVKPNFDFFPSSINSIYDFFSDKR